MATIETSLGSASRGLPVLEPALDPGLLRDARLLTAQMAELVRVIQFRDRDRACCYDVSVSQCYALKGIVGSPDGLSVNELAAHLYLDKSTASRLANSLVEKAYVLRARDGEDGRVVKLVATPEGQALARAIAEGETREYAELLADFGPEFRTELNRLVGRLGRCFAASVDASGGSCCVVR